MIVYLDTSALVKLYIDEAGAPIVRRAAREAELMATSEIAYVEMRAALARRHREGDLSARGHRRVLESLHADWAEMFVLSLGGALIKDAGNVAERYRLRAYDAIHLASALLLRERGADRRAACVGPPAPCRFCSGVESGVAQRGFRDDPDRRDRRTCR